MPRCRKALLGLGAAVGIALAGHDQLAALDGHLQLVGREAGHRQGDAHPAVVGLLDIVGRIAFGGGLGGALDQVSGVFEAQQEGAVEQDRPGHREVLAQATSFAEKDPRVGADPHDTWWSLAESNR
jgi:hypothetical protein